MTFGYARVSTDEQKLDFQIDALLGAGVDKKNIFTDISTGTRTERPGLDNLLNKLRSGDLVVVWKIDRIARSVSHLSKLIENFHKENISFKSLQEPFIDTTTSHGKFVFTLFSAVAQLERDMISERTKAALESSKRRLRFGGRPAGLSNKTKKVSQTILRLYSDPKIPVSEICEITKLSRRTIYKVLKTEGVEVGEYNYKK